MTETPSWFHCTTHTYGAWLYGDPRGYRTRHHREHVEGDYKNPPPAGMYQSQFERSKKLMKQPAVILSPPWRAIVESALVEMLHRLESQLLVLSTSGQHCHLLAKMPGGPVPREWLGRAKKHANFICKEHGWTGKLWAVRSKVIPIKDYGHHVNTYNYIKDHRFEGAWVWDFRGGVIPPESPGTAVPGLSGEQPA